MANATGALAQSLAVWSGALFTQGMNINGTKQRGRAMQDRNAVHG